MSQAFVAFQPVEKVPPARHILRNVRFGLWLLDVCEDFVWIERIEPCLGLARLDDSSGEC